jgi:hypothetical protein
MHPWVEVIDDDSYYHLCIQCFQYLVTQCAWFCWMCNLFTNSK